MSRPVRFVLDDNGPVERSLRDHLGRRLSQDFRVPGESPPVAERLPSPTCS